MKESTKLGNGVRAVGPSQRAARLERRRPLAAPSRKPAASSHSAGLRLTLSAVTSQPETVSSGRHQVRWQRCLGDRQNTQTGDCFEHRCCRRCGEAGTKRMSCNTALTRPTQPGAGQPQHGAR